MIAILACVFRCGSLRAAALLLGVLVMTASGCTSRRVVYIPNEWRTPPAAVTTSQPRSTPPAPSGPAEPIIRPTPEIEEHDIAAAPDKPMDATATPEEPLSDELPKATAAASPETPQYLASMHLVNTARTALQQGATEQAIAQLEQAIQVDVYNAEAFFVLAQAWDTKGDLKRALEFARKAEILSQDEPQALRKVYLLEVDLLKRTGQASEAEIYRQKANRLEM